MYRTSIKLFQLHNWIFNCENNVSFGIIHVLHCTIVLNFMQMSSTNVINKALAFLKYVNSKNKFNNIPQWKLSII